MKQGKSGPVWEALASLVQEVKRGWVMDYVPGRIAVLRGPYGRGEPTIFFPRYTVTSLFKDRALMPAYMEKVALHRFEVRMGPYRYWAYAACQEEVAAWCNDPDRMNPMQP